MQKAGKRISRGQEQRRKALDLRIAGASYQQIGDALEISTQAAWTHVQKALEESRKITAETAAKVRDMEVKRLDSVLMALWPKRADPRFADSIMRAMERRSRLLGLDAPTRAEMQVKNLTLEQIGDELKRRKAEESSGGDGTGQPA